MLSDNLPDRGRMFYVGYQLTSEWRMFSTHLNNAIKTPVATMHSVRTSRHDAQQLFPIFCCICFIVQGHYEHGISCINWEQQMSTVKPFAEAA